MPSRRLAESARAVGQFVAHAAGVHVSRIKPGRPGRDVFADAARIADAAGDPVETVLDVGANRGQTARRARSAFPTARVHSFEPGEAWPDLERLAAADDRLTANRCGVGAEAGTLTLNCFTQSEMTSFLAPGPAAWGRVEQTREVPVVALDDYCAEAGLTRVDLLKIDTQGFELNVLTGAERLLRSGAVRAVYLEVNFAPLYEGQPRADAVLAHLWDRGYDLVTFYGQHYRRGRAAWTDALFAHRSALPAWKSGPAPAA